MRGVDCDSGVRAPGPAAGKVAPDPSPGNPQRQAGKTVVEEAYLHQGMDRQRVWRRKRGYFGYIAPIGSGGRTFM